MAGARRGAIVVRELFSRDGKTAELERANCGFEKVERFPSNVGYLKFNFFADPKVCGPTATAAMGLLAHVDALIVDMRENGGGDPRMVAYVTSYLFKERTHLNDLYVRPTNKTHEFWTDPSLPGSKLGETPVYVNKGVGYGWRFRFGVRPEVAVFHLHRG